ncbi:hypothetical protein VTN96DRAFT_935 [Rasamsonia emersonii]
MASTGLLPRSLADILPVFSFNNNPLHHHTLLPLLGLVSSTGALTFAYAEVTYLAPLLAVDEGSNNNDNKNSDDNDNDKRIPPIRTVWEKSFPLGVSLVLSQGAGSLIGGIAGYLLSRRKDNTKAAAGWLYVAGTVFSMAHFVLVPWIIAAIRPIVEPDSPEGKKAARNGNRDNLRQWLRVHAVRTLVSDIPAFLSFLGATAAYFS